MTFYRRHLHHIYQEDQPVLLTWRLYDSLPPNRCFRADAVTHGKAFAAMDRLLDEVRTGQFYLRHPEIAIMVVEAIHYNATTLNRYKLHAFAVMPNHVHILVSPHVPLPDLVCRLKTFTAKRANQILALTGSRFWQEENYDHLVRNDLEFRRIKSYIEQNPVRAGLVAQAEEYRWSSAWAGPGGPAAGRGRPPYC